MKDRMHYNCKSAAVKQHNGGCRLQRQRTMIAAVVLSTATTGSAAAVMPPSIIDASSSFVAVGDTTADDTSILALSSGATLRHAMGELGDALSETRKLIDAADNDSNGGSSSGNSADAQEVQQNASDDIVYSMDDDEALEMNEESNASTNFGRPSPPPHPEQGRPSSNWWERLYQGGPLYDEKTGLLIEETRSEGPKSTSTRPANRRSHSATVYNQHPNEVGTEWMIISGGFTDDDWNSFPVWAYAMTNSRSISEIEDEFGQGLLSGGDAGMTGPWIDLMQSSAETAVIVDDAGARVSGSSADSTVGPQGRVGHLSSVHNDCLYIFGGLTYKLGAFHVDYDNENGNALVIWKACDLDKIISSRIRDQRGSPENMEGLKWEKIIPRVDTRPPIQPGVTCTKSNDGTTCVKSNDENAHERSKDEDGDNLDHHHNKLRRRAQRVPLAATGRVYQNKHNATNVISTIPEQMIHQNVRSEVVEPPDPSFTLPRGEAQGGNYPGSAKKDCFVFYGGMHHHHSLTEASLQATTILGDVWKYDYETETLSMLAPYPPLPWQRDERNGSYPKARTAHAGTIVSNQLIIHGGMHFSDDDSSKSSSSFSSPSNSYATYKTSSRWQPLSDVWEFDLETLKWRERMQFPQLARSYHSLVGWGNGTVAAFGGFQQDNNIPGETVAFVFKDLILSRPNETNWLKLVPPNANGNSAPMSHWRSSSSSREPYGRPSISNRLEHSAVLDGNGSMYIWGGRFQTVGQIVGLWRLDVFNEDANLKYEIAPPDGIEQYEAELQALHMFIATMMFMSLTISSLFSMMRRQAAEGEDGGGGGIGRVLGRRGLSQQAIDAIPLKRYEAPHTEVTEDGDIVEDVSLSRENSRDESSSESGLQLDNADCCPICLVEYEPGVSEIRTLPCGHIFDRECIDSWFADHTTCPSCRTDIDDSPAAQEEQTREAIEEQYEFDPRLQFISGFDDTRRRHSHWTGDNNSSGGIAGLGSFRHSRWNRRGAVEVSGSEESEDENDDNQIISNDDEQNHGHEINQRPMFLGIRNFFRLGHRALAIPGEETEDEVPVTNIELV